MFLQACIEGKNNFYQLDTKLVLPEIHALQRFGAIAVN
jgi:hypothetical protein